MNSGRDAAATIYANEADPAFRRRALWIGQELANHHGGPGASVLDIGCGRGFYLPLYEKLGLSATGVERDPGPRHVAEQTAARTGARIIDASAENLPFVDESHDIVVMSEILEHLDDPLSALTEAYRVLRSGGLLLITVPNAEYPFLWDPINFTLERVARRPIKRGPLAGIWANHIRLYTQTALSEPVSQAGFHMQDCFAHTTACLPFVHNIVYGLGMPLLENRLLPGVWASGAERGTGRQPKGYNPVALGIRLIHWCDRGNTDRAAPGRRAQNICLKATKP